MAAVTSTVSVQLPLAGIERPAGKVTVVPPAAATGAPAPVHVVPALGVGATTTPLGRVSTSAEVRVATAALALLSVTVASKMPPALIVAGLKALPRKGRRLARRQSAWRTASRGCFHWWLPGSRGTC